MRPGEYHDDALPRPSYEGLFGTILCARCDFFGLGYMHPETCTWEWLKEAGQEQDHLDLVELGDRVVERLAKSEHLLPIINGADLGSEGETTTSERLSSKPARAEDVRDG